MITIKCGKENKKEVAELLKEQLIDRCEFVDGFEYDLEIKEKDDVLEVIIPEDEVYGDTDSYPTNVWEALDKVKKKFKGIAIDGSCYVMNYTYDYATEMTYHCSAEDKKVSAEEKTFGAEDEVDEQICMIKGIKWFKRIKFDEFIEKCGGTVGKRFWKETDSSA